MNDEEQIDRILRGYGAGLRRNAEQRFASSRSRLIRAAVAADSRTEGGYIEKLQAMFSRPQFTAAFAAAAIALVLTVNFRGPEPLKNSDRTVDGAGSAQAIEAAEYDALLAFSEPFSAGLDQEDLALNDLEGAFSPPAPAADDERIFWPGGSEASLLNDPAEAEEINTFEEYYYDYDETA